jgi:hypothetical protein
MNINLNLVVFPSTTEDEKRTTRETALSVRASGAYEALTAALPSEAARSAAEYRMAEWRHRAHWEKRTERAERLLRRLLSAGVLQGEERELAMELAYGSRGVVGPELKGLSNKERDLVANYRALDVPGRQMLRTLCERLLPSGSTMTKERSDLKAAWTEQRQ